MVVFLTSVNADDPDNVPRFDISNWLLCRWFREIADGLKEMSGSWDRRILWLRCLAMLIAPHAPAALYRCKMRIAAGTDFALNCFGQYVMINEIQGLGISI
jgi:hypothetical protein